MAEFSRSDRWALAFFCATACLAFVAWAFPNMTRYLTIPGAIVTFCLTVYFAWPEIRIFGSIRLPYLYATAATTLSILVCSGLLYFGIQLFGENVLCLERGPLAALTNEELREKTHAFTMEIRKFDWESKSQVDKIENDFSDKHLDTQRMGHEAEIRNQQIRTLETARQSEFIATYRQRALTLRDELKTRLHCKLPPYPEEGPFGKITALEGSQIFGGSALSGSGPIGAGADLLDYWTSRLE